MIGVVMGVPTLREIFEEKYYADLEGGILESFGRLFKNALKLYVYPLKDPTTGALITAENLRVAPNLRHLYAYMLENLYIQGLRGYSEAVCQFSRGTSREDSQGRQFVGGYGPAAGGQVNQGAEAFLDMAGRQRQRRRAILNDSSNLSSEGLAAEDVRL